MAKAHCLYLSTFPISLKVITKFRDDELEHLETGLEHDAMQVREILLNAKILKIINSFPLFLGSILLHNETSHSDWV